MENTGYKSFETLERYYTDDGTSTGETKPNIVTDPDYIAPFLDTTTCPPGSRFYNTAQTKTITRNNCGSGYSGSDVTLTAYPNQFVSNESVLDANNQAIAWLEANAQIYANNVGTCTATILDTIPPTAPTGLRCYSSDENHLTLEWNASTDNVGVVRYEVFRRINNGTYGTDPYFGTPNITGVFYATIDETYYFKVRAKDAAGNYSPFSSEISGSV